MDRTDVTLTPLTIKPITRRADQSAPLPPTHAMEHVQTTFFSVEHKCVRITALATKSTTGPVGQSALVQASSAIEAVLMAGLPVVTGVRKIAMRIATETVALNVSATTTSVKASAPLTELSVENNYAKKTQHTTGRTTDHVIVNALTTTNSVKENAAILSSLVEIVIALKSLQTTNPKKGLVENPVSGTMSLVKEDVGKDSPYAVHAAVCLRAQLGSGAVGTCASPSHPTVLGSALPTRSSATMASPA